MICFSLFRTVIKILKSLFNCFNLHRNLAKILNYKTNDYDSPHVKVNILLQMYLSDIELPNQEYIVDLKSVLDQAIRILQVKLWKCNSSIILQQNIFFFQAMIDITSNNGWLSCTIRIINIMQMLTQGHWLHESNILSIPHIKKPTLLALKHEISNTEKLRSCNALTIAGIKYASLKYAQVLETALINVYGMRIGVDIMKSIKMIPWIEMNFAVIHVESRNKIFVDLCNIREPIEMISGEEYEFSFCFNRRMGEEKGMLQSPRFPKKKDESWFLCLGTDDELIAVKRVQTQKRMNSSLKIIAPSLLGLYTYCGIKIVFLIYCKTTMLILPLNFQVASITICIYYQIPI